jgi:hypothetical protein
VRGGGIQINATPAHFHPFGSRQNGGMPADTEYSSVGFLKHASKIMATWYYAYFFPDCEQELEPVSALAEITQHGLSFQDKYTLLDLVDEDGHSEATGPVRRLHANGTAELARLLDHKEQLQIMANNNEFWMYCTFNNNAENPHIVFSWSKSIFESLGEDARLNHRSLMLSFARKAKAPFVIILPESGGYFEDHFIKMDGRRVLDVRLPDMAEYQVREIWIDPNMIQEFPFGVDPTPLGHYLGYNCYDPEY